MESYIKPTTGKPYWIPMQSRIRDLVGVGGFIVLVTGVAMYDKAGAMIVGGGLALAVALYGTLRQ